MPTFPNIHELERRLVPLDRACDILNKFVKEAKERLGFYSAGKATNRRKRLNVCVMELISHIKKEIELKELYITHSIYKEMIEIVQGRQQEIRRAISMLQNWNEVYTLELQHRKLRVEEIEKINTDCFRFQEEPDVLMRGLQQKKTKPAICLLENNFGSARWLKEELARSAQRLQEGQVKSAQNLQQEINCKLQMLYQGFLEITRKVEKKNAEVSLRFPQRFARSARIQVQAEIAQLKQLYTEITQLLQQEQKESSLHLQQRQVAHGTNLLHGQDVPAMRLQQDKEFWVRLPQKQSDATRCFHQAGAELILQQNQVEQAFHLQQEQAEMVICLQQEQTISTMHSQQEEARAAMHLQQEDRRRVYYRRMQDSRCAYSYW
ncbi:hypothetical protein TNCV_910451 [Trichonephila clavipes]|uniref:Uncharacterized protein n=1 Tax=Trichonephila clavipes TaxID=2585209 RepID=A0A8X6W3R6_TRICX|nr:hypothetical protein TNCV_910451 [Trichonephila clavipes]